MTAANVAWILDHRGRPVLELNVDGHPAHIRSSQRTELLEHGVVKGMVYFASERATQFPNAFMRGGPRPELSKGDLVGCTDDPAVFALFEQMCRAILDGTWRPGPRPSAG
ncbi:MAG: hypothetical protein M3O34_19365 [Chloroflexota bacterium]|nr:hypothetical protein [Chloroflexota bacterium]